MATKSVFISFDYDHDNELRGSLVAQAKDPESPFSITDWSVMVRNRIRRVDLVIVICGEHTHDAAGVAGEVTITQEERKPYFLLKGRRIKTCTKPRNVRSSDEIHSWTWPNLRKLIENA